MISIFILFTFICQQTCLADISSTDTSSALAPNARIHGPRDKDDISRFIMEAIRIKAEQGRPNPEILGYLTDWLAENQPLALEGEIAGIELLTVTLPGRVEQEAFRIALTDTAERQNEYFVVGRGGEILDIGVPAHQVPVDKQLARARHTPLDQGSVEAIRGIGQELGGIVDGLAQDVETLLAAAYEYQASADAETEVFPLIHFVEDAEAGYRIEGFRGHPGGRAIQFLRELQGTDEFAERAEHELIAYIFEYDDAQVREIQSDLAEYRETEDADARARLVTALSANKRPVPQRGPEAVRDVLASADEKGASEADASAPQVGKKPSLAGTDKTVVWKAIEAGVAAYRADTAKNPTGQAPTSINMIAPYVSRCLADQGIEGVLAGPKAGSNLTSWIRVRAQEMSDEFAAVGRAEDPVQLYAELVQISGIERKSRRRLGPMEKRRLDAEIAADIRGITSDYRLRHRGKRPPKKYVLRRVGEFRRVRQPDVAFDNWLAKVAGEQLKPKLAATVVGGFTQPTNELLCDAMLRDLGMEPEGPVDDIKRLAMLQEAVADHKGQHGEKSPNFAQVCRLLARSREFKSVTDANTWVRSFATREFPPADATDGARRESFTALLAREDVVLEKRYGRSGAVGRMDRLQAKAAELKGEAEAAGKPVAEQPPTIRELADAFPEEYENPAALNVWLRQRAIANAKKAVGAERVTPEIQEAAYLRLVQDTVGARFARSRQGLGSRTKPPTGTAKGSVANLLKATDRTFRTIAELAERAEVAKSTAGRDLNTLFLAEMLERRVEGRTYRYRKPPKAKVSDERIALAQAYLDDLFDLDKTGNRGNVGRYSGPEEEKLTTALHDNFVEPLTLKKERPKPGVKTAKAVYNEDAREAGHVINRIRRSQKRYGNAGPHKFILTINEHDDKTTPDQREAIEIQAAHIIKEMGAELVEIRRTKRKKDPTFTFDCMDANGNHIGTTSIDQYAYRESFDRTSLILSMGFAAAAIPEDLTEEDREYYIPLLKRINILHSRVDILGRDLIDIEASLDRIVMILHVQIINIVLPPIERMDFEQPEEFELQRDALERYA